MLSFAAMHNNLTMEKVTSFIQKNKHKLNDDMYHKMAQELLNKKIGYDFIKDKQYDWHKLANRKDKTLITKYWLAMKLNKNVGDISSVKKIPPCDLLTFSFPCQDISLAGLQKGVEKGKTRSGLVYEVIRLLNQAKKDNQLPKYLIMENVKNLIGTKFIDKFKDLNTLLIVKQLWAFKPYMWFSMYVIFIVIHANVVVPIISYNSFFPIVNF